MRDFQKGAEKCTKCVDIMRLGLELRGVGVVGHDGEFYFPLGVNIPLSTQGNWNFKKGAERFVKT